MNERGHTLVEVLVVVAILVICGTLSRAAHPGLLRGGRTCSAPARSSAASSARRGPWRPCAASTRRMRFEIEAGRLVPEHVHGRQPQRRAVGGHREGHRPAHRGPASAHERRRRRAGRDQPRRAGHPAGPRDARPGRSHPVRAIRTCCRSRRWGLRPRAPSISPAPMPRPPSGSRRDRARAADGLPRRHGGVETARWCRGERPGGYGAARRLPPGDAGRPPGARHAGRSRRRRDRRLPRRSGGRQPVASAPMPPPSTAERSASRTDASDVPGEMRFSPDARVARLDGRSGRCARRRAHGRRSPACGTSAGARWRPTPAGSFPAPSAQRRHELITDLGSRSPRGVLPDPRQTPAANLRRSSARGRPSADPTPKRRAGGRSGSSAPLGALRPAPVLSVAASGLLLAPMTSHVYLILTSILYAVGALHVLLQALTRRRLLTSWTVSATLAGFALHTAGLSQRWTEAGQFPAVGPARRRVVPGLGDRPRLPHDVHADAGRRAGAGRLPRRLRAGADREPDPGHASADPILQEHVPAHPRHVRVLRVRRALRRLQRRRPVPHPGAGAEEPRRRAPSTTWCRASSAATP